MSRLIADILGASEPHFSHGLKELERLSGHAGHDNRIISDISARRNHAVSNLGLDARDTTSRELFYSLRHKSVQLNQQLESHLGIVAESTADQVIDAVCDFVEALPSPRSVWIIKHSVIKETLASQPPKKLMKALQLRSVDSMLKRGNSYELLALAYQMESVNWRVKLQQTLKRLKASDFVASNLVVVRIDQKKLAKLEKASIARSRIVTPNYESGRIIVLPPNRRFSLDTLAVTLSLLQAMHDLRVYSAYFRHISVRSDFGKQYVNALTNGLPGSASEASIGWRTLHNHLNKRPKDIHLVEQPHLQSEDIIQPSPLLLLTIEIPDAEFWQSLEHAVSSRDGHTVSLNLVDNVINASNNLPFEKAVYPYGRRDVWSELGSYYLQHEAVKTKIIDQLERNK